MSDIALEPQHRLTRVQAYHQRTKHRPDGYAKGPETLDWNAQPDPFRRYHGAPVVHLPLVADSLTLAFSALFDTAPVATQPLNLLSIAALLEMSLGLSAWKQYGPSRWSLRCNPSSGNLHPTEAYIIATGIEGLEDGVYHYCADEHLLEHRCRFALSSTPTNPQLLVGFSSIYWREEWKYGERAFRYCHLDVGHAMASVSYAGAVLGWRLKQEYSLGSDQLALLLGLDRVQDFGKAERECPDVLMQVLPMHQEDPVDIVSWLEQAEQGRWVGAANVLDLRHFYSWPVIDEVSVACHRPPAKAAPLSNDIPCPSPIPTLCTEPAAKIFRRRRSAQAFDHLTPIPKQDFYRLLDHLLPRKAIPPWSSTQRVAIHLVLFVHRVEGLSPGLYAMPRRIDSLAMLKGAMSPTFTWQPIAGAPDHLPLYHLISGKAERVAARLACQQSIASDSAFSLAMLAEFDGILSPDNTLPTPWVYPELFWEAGIVGQALYMEAEACGLRGTGIGCFFDDGVHELLGITSKQLQSLYHFTIGTPIVDKRIISLSPYSHLNNRENVIV